MENEIVIDISDIKAISKEKQQLIFEELIKKTEDNKVVMQGSFDDYEQLTFFVEDWFFDEENILHMTGRFRETEA